MSRWSSTANPTGGIETPSAVGVHASACFWNHAHLQK